MRQAARTQDAMWENPIEVSAFWANWIATKYAKEEGRPFSYWPRPDTK